MKRLIWLPVAGFLVIAGAAVAAAAPSLVDQARGLVSPSLRDDGGAVTVTSDARPGQDLLADVLADLVSNGTITQAQSDAITSGLQQALDDKRAEMKARMQLMKDIVADGVITQAEVDQLPADDPLRVAFDSIAEDGQLNLEDLRGLGPGIGFGFGHFEHGGHGGRGGPGFWPAPDNGSDPSASPSPSADSDS